MARRIATRFDIGLIGSGIKYQVRIPLGRRGSSDEVATAALFLASDMSSYIQGALIPVDGASCQASRSFSVTDSFVLRNLKGGKQWQQRRPFSCNQHTGRCGGAP